MVIRGPSAWWIETQYSFAHLYIIICQLHASTMIYRFVIFIIFILTSCKKFRIRLPILMPSAWNFYVIYATHYFVCAEMYMYQVNAFFGYIVGFVRMIYSNKEIFETQYLLHDIKSLFPSLDFHFRYSVVTSGQPRHVSVREQRRHDVWYKDIFSVVHSHVLNTQCQVHDIRRSSAHKHDWKSRDIIIIPWRHMSIMVSHMRIAESVNHVTSL